MGSWSVYCGISNIAITAGTPCVVLPLKKNSSYRSGYFEYLPATPPIFGDYDDYGGQEDIQDDAGTKLIEEHFGVDIHSFSQYFTRGIITQGEDDYPKQLMNVEEMKGWKFMFIDRQVYDFMANHAIKDSLGDLEMGNKEILKLIGFEYVGEKLDNPTYDPKRFKHHWTFQGKDFYSDGTWLHFEKNGIHHFSGSYKSGALTTYVDLPEDKLWLAKMTMTKLWKHLSRKSQIRHLTYILGVDGDILSMRDTFAKFEGTENMSDALKEILDRYKPKNETITDKIINNLDTFGDTLADLTTISRNLHPMSSQFHPYIPYLTPQCGEREEHLKIERAFCDIAAGIIKKQKEEWGDDDEDEDDEI